MQNIFDLDQSQIDEVNGGGFLTGIIPAGNYLGAIGLGPSFGTSWAVSRGVNFVNGSLGELLTVVGYRMRAAISEDIFFGR